MNVSGKTSNINFTLEVGKYISGFVARQDNGEPITNTNVLVCDSCLTPISNCWTDSRGYYSIGGLRTDSSYYVRATGECNNSTKSYKEEYYKESPDRTHATLITLLADTNNINFTLEEAISIMGRVVRHDNDEPISEAQVIAYDSTWNFFKEARTDQNGFYQVGALDSGKYYIEASGKIWWNFKTYGDWKQEYVGEYFNRVRQRENATLLNVTATLTDINFTLEKAISIMGKVVRHDNDEPIPEAQVLAYDSLWNFIKEARTDNNGFYQVGALDSGKYYIEASGKIWWNFETYGDWKQEYVGEFYNRVRQRENATLLNVTATLTDINFYLKHHTGVAWKPTNNVPDQFYLFQNHPNPFNPTTTVEYGIPVTGHVQLVIYDVLGRHIKTLVDGQHATGHFQATWDGTDEHNLPIAAGVYFCRMEAGEFVKVIKLAFVK